MHRVVLAAAVLLAATSAQSQSVRRLPPQAAPRTVNTRPPQVPTAPPAPARLTPAARVQAVQQLMDTPTPPALGTTVHLAVSAPIGSDGSYLGYFSPQNLFPHMNLASFSGQGSLEIRPPNWPAGLKLFDCAVTTFNDGPLDWNTWNASGSTSVGGQAPVVDGHVIFVANTFPTQPVSLSKAGGGGWNFRWCDITRLG